MPAEHSNSANRRHHV